MLACEGNTTLQDTRSPSSMRTRMQEYADTYAGVCGHVCRSMRTRIQEDADTYTLTYKTPMQQNVGGIRPREASD
jgi:hypothetical protein